MGRKTGIEWTDRTFNPWRGCEKIAAGCLHCYAARDSRKNPAILGSWAPGAPRVVAPDKYWAQLDAWDREAKYRGDPLLVFCASMADVFEDNSGHLVTTKGDVVFADQDGRIGPQFTARLARLKDVRKKLFDEIPLRPKLIFQLLTKRIGLVPQQLDELGVRSLPTSWIGASAANHRETIQAVEGLEAVADRFALSFLSLEPLVGPVELGAILKNRKAPDWVIVGGESAGPGETARPCAIEWIWEIVLVCRELGIDCFVKQLGSFAITENANLWDLPIGSLEDVGRADAPAAAARLRLQDKKGGDPFEWPIPVDVREFPIARSA